MKKADLDLVREFMKTEKIDPLNTRVFKTLEGTYIVTIGSIEKSHHELKYKDHTFQVVSGEFSGYLEEVNYYLSHAKTYAANDTQREML